MKSDGFLASMLDPDGKTSSTRVAVLIVVFWTMCLVTAGVVHTIMSGGDVPFIELTYLIGFALFGKAADSGIKKIGANKETPKVM